MSHEEDIVDAEFETITAQNASGKTSPNEKNSAPTRAEQVDEGQLAVFGSSNAGPSAKPLSLPLFTLIAAICSVGAFYLAGGHILFGSSPSQPAVETALAIGAAIDEQTLKIEDVSSKLIDRSNLKVLTIKATIANVDNVAQSVPTIIVRLGDDPATGRMFRINRGETLEPGERLVFTNSLPVGNAPDTKPVLSFSE